MPCGWPRATISCSRRRVRLLEAFVSRSDVTDCTQYALQWLA